MTELDLIFKFIEALHILDQVFVGGELCETSLKEIVKGYRSVNEDMYVAEEILRNV